MRTLYTRVQCAESRYRYIEWNARGEENVEERAPFANVPRSYKGGACIYARIRVMDRGAVMRFVFSLLYIYVCNGFFVVQALTYT